MAEKVNSAPPKPPIELAISIGGENWSYVRRALSDMLCDLDEYGSLASALSGGGGGRYSIRVARRDVPVEQYRAELRTWFEEQPTEVHDVRRA